MSASAALCEVQAMKNFPRWIFAVIAGALSLCTRSDGATAARPLAGESAVRMADADWAATASKGADAWMSFYSADAIVLLPNEQLADGADLIRGGVSRLLAMPHLILAWHPTNVQLTEPGDAAYETGIYELRFDDAQGAPGAMRGSLLKIWRKTSDGAWKCVVDTWSPAAPLPKAAAAVPDPPLSAASRAPTPARIATQYGDMPLHSKEAIQNYFKEHLKDPGSVQYREITEPEQGYATAITGGLLMHERRDYGWKVKAVLDAKNSHGRYVGFKSYTFMFRGEKIIHTLSPLSEDEIN